MDWDVATIPSLDQFGIEIAATEPKGDTVEPALKFLKHMGTSFR